MILPLLACLTLVGASSAPLAVSSLPFGNEPLPQYVVFDDDSQIINFDADEVNNYTFENTYSFLTSYYAQEGGDNNVLGYVRVNDLSFLNASLSDGVISWILPNDVTSFVSFGNSSYKFEITLNSALSSFNTMFSLDVAGYDEPVNLYAPLKAAVQADIEANSSGMSGVEVVNEIVDILAGGLTSLGSSIGVGVATFAHSLAFTDGHLSVYFVLVIAFAGVALAVGLTTLIFRWLTNLGN